MRRTAVILFNLGGPDSLDAVGPFLFNLFNDPAIIRAPAPLRWLLAKLISRRRTPAARAIYAQMGGQSPLLELTREQAKALEEELSDLGETRAFPVMRYWHPLSDEVAREVKAFAPDEAVLLPLYPQYSTTTTGSSLADWTRAAASAGLDVASRAVCCYPITPPFIAAHGRLIAAALDRAQERAKGTPRLLLSAHGLPKKVVAAGDPYQWQVEQTAAAIVAALARPDLDWALCYQSRVGPLEWIRPATEDEIRRAGRDGVPLVVAPIAFVSEHSETLVELDVEYRKLAGECGVPAYVRVPALGVEPDFIRALAEIVRAALNAGPGREAVDSARGGRLCPARHRRCPLAGAEAPSG